MKKSTISLLVAFAGLLFFVFQNCSPLGEAFVEEADSNNNVMTSGSSTPLNIVYIMLDDVGYHDFINPDIISPTFDKLERKALKFTHFYTNPTCSPTRVSFMTGRNPVKFGIEHAVCVPDSSISIASERVKSGSARGIPRTMKTIPEILKTMNYKSAHIGKWHIGERDGKKPAHKGFDDTIVYTYDNHKFTDPEIRTFVGRNLVSKKIVEGHKTDILTNYALNVLNKHGKNDKSKGLFLNLWYNAGHHPYVPSSTWKNKYTAKAGLGAEQKKYYAVISQADWNIGKIIRKIENDPALNKNTLIFVTSDNGGSAKMDGGIPDEDGNNERNYSNYPMRGVKGKLFEGGVRLPLYAYWVGGNLPAGKRNHSVLRSSDMLKTIVELAGGNYTGVTEGESFASLLRSNSNYKGRSKAIFWSQRDQIKYCGPKDRFIASQKWKENPHRHAVRIEDWKFITEYKNEEPHKEYLFKMKSGESEDDGDNLSDSMPDKVSAMRTLLNSLAVNRSQIATPIDSKKGNVKISTNKIFFEGNGRVELRKNDLFEFHDGNFTFALKVKPYSATKNRYNMLAQRNGSWGLMILPNGRVRLNVHDEQTGAKVSLTSTTALQPGVEYKVAFTITGHTGSDKVEEKSCEGYNTQSTYVNNVARLYVYPSSQSSVPEPEDINGDDIYNVSFSGYDNSIYIGNDVLESLPFRGQLTVLGANSLALSPAQLKILINGN